MGRRSSCFRDIPRDAVYGQMSSPIGPLTIVASGSGLHCVLWESDFEDVASKSTLELLDRNQDDKLICEVKKQLEEYFAGERKQFDLPLFFSGTDFQKKCWRQLTTIAYGETITYADQAEKVGGRNKARAVGMANGLNPVSIVVPCHRVIGASGSLTGFAGGVEAKRFLLDLEAG